MFPYEQALSYNGEEVGKAEKQEKKAQITGDRKHKVRVEEGEWSTEVLIPAQRAGRG